jgi:hypothetical protein
MPWHIHKAEVTNWKSGDHRSELPMEWAAQGLEAKTIKQVLPDARQPVEIFKAVTQTASSNRQADKSAPRVGKFSNRWRSIYAAKRCIANLVDALILP